MNKAIKHVCESLANIAYSLDEAHKEEESIKEYITSAKRENDIWQLIHILESDFLMDSEEVMQEIVISLEEF